MSSEKMKSSKFVANGALYTHLQYTKPSLLLSLNSLEELNVIVGHECSSCGFMLDEEVLKYLIIRRVNSLGDKNGTGLYHI